MRDVPRLTHQCIVFGQLVFFYDGDNIACVYTPPRTTEPIVVIPLTPIEKLAQQSQ